LRRRSDYQSKTFHSPWIYRKPATVSGIKFIVQNVLKIDLHGKMGTLEVFDITGKSVQYKLINGNKMSIDVSGLRAGIYLLQINSNEGIVNRKFVKE
jgi:hypothetical protein